MPNDNGRSKAFTNREKKILCDLVVEYKEFIENKKTDANTNSEKKRAWLTISRKYNANRYVTERSAGQLKRCWEKLKAIVKAQKIAEMRHLVDSGGGPSVNALEDPIFVQVEAIVPYLDEDIEDLDGDCQPIHQLVDAASTRLLPIPPNPNSSSPTPSPIHLPPSTPISLPRTSSSSPIWELQLPASSSASAESFVAYVASNPVSSSAPVSTTSKISGGSPSATLTVTKDQITRLLKKEVEVRIERVCEAKEQDAERHKLQMEILWAEKRAAEAKAYWADREGKLKAELLEEQLRSLRNDDNLL